MMVLINELAVAGAVNAFSVVGGTITCRRTVYTSFQSKCGPVSCTTVYVGRYDV